MSEADHWFEPKVAGLCEQDRTQTDREVCHTRSAFADMGKLMGESRARMEFEEHLRQVDAGSRVKTWSRSVRKLAGSSSLSSHRQRQGVPPVGLLHPDGAIGGKLAAVRWYVVSSWWARAWSSGSE